MAQLKTRPLTEAENDMLSEVADWYWGELGKLVAKALSKVPRRLQDALLVDLQDKSSVYGSAFQDHMKRKTPLFESVDKILKRP